MVTNRTGESCSGGSTLFEGRAAATAWASTGGDGEARRHLRPTQHARTARVIIHSVCDARLARRAAGRAERLAWDGVPASPPAPRLPAVAAFSTVAPDQTRLYMYWTHQTPPPTIQTAGLAGRP